MNIKFLRYAFTFVLLSLLISSCSQEEGVGGNSYVKGTLIEEFRNKNNQLLYKQAAKDEDIFLLFGDKEVIGEKTNTSFSGEFEFEYLWPGDYKLYYYSDNIENPDKGKVEIIKEFTLGKNQTLDIGELVTSNLLDYDDGNASISGRVLLINYKNTTSWPNLLVKDTARAQEHEIYLIYDDNEYYCERIRTSYDGTFRFGNLIKGNYRVFLYSEDISGRTEKVVITKSETINTDKQNIDLGDIYIEQL